MQPERSQVVQHQSQRIKQNWRISLGGSTAEVLGSVSWQPPQEWRRPRDSIKVPVTYQKLSIPSKNETRLKLKGLVLCATMLNVVFFDLIKSFLTALGVAATDLHGIESTKEGKAIITGLIYFSCSLFKWHLSQMTLSFVQ